ncbi:beta-ketoacyl-ACP synthase III [uncultured Deinococcus sp.]|uniref:beta-ketoacyl-ACP synthase III n=1 Tax=uncultured Deinococcus sp. TaxID=158789 RepID=UPI002587D377|nr:beta-ketoacyl-ACP synthase III [uncultured Deinococcus sp.]
MTAVSGPAPLSSAPAVGIVAVGGYAPAQVVPNAHYAARLETTDEWIRSRSGIRERRHAAPGETASVLGGRAVQDLLARFPGALEGVDLVICATSSPDAMFPSTAALIAGAAGLRGAAAFDVSVACSGFVYALSVAHAMVVAGTARRALVVGAEVMSRVVDQDDRSTAILFGDGAGAVVVGPVPAGYGVQAFALGADSSGGPSLFLRGAAVSLPGGTPMGPHLTQNGREVFKFAVRIMGDMTEEVMRRAGLTVADIAVFVPHQANVRIIEAALDRFGLPPERAVVNLDRYGNTSAASIPLALAEAQAQGRLTDGAQVVLAGFGGGLSWGAAALRWWAARNEASGSTPTIF